MLNVQVNRTFVLIYGPNKMKGGGYIVNIEKYTLFETTQKRNNKTIKLEQIETIIMQFILEIGVQIPRTGNTLRTFFLFSNRYSIFILKFD